MITTCTEIIIGEGDLLGHVFGTEMYLGRPSEHDRVDEREPYVILKFTGPEAVDSLIKQLQFLRNNYVKDSSANY